MELRLQSEWMPRWASQGITQITVCNGPCNSMPENELTNDYSIRRK